MSIFSYAQNLEDVLLWRALKHVKAGTYIDIGAQDPIVDSVSKCFYEQGWRGLHVEPTAQYADLLRRDRPDETVLQVAVSDRPGLLTFYVVPDTGESTASREVSQGASRHGAKVFETTVAAVTLDQVFARCDSKEIHWLKIDVEGSEQAVLKGWRRSTRRPWIVLVEATTPLTQEESHKEWEALLLSKGYTYVYFDGLNRYYVSAAHKDLRKHLRQGVSIWDDYQLPDLSYRTASLRQHHQETLDQIRSELDTTRAQLQQSHGVLAQVRGELEQKRAELGQSHGVVGQVQGELEQTRSQLHQSHGVLSTTRSELEQQRAELAQSQSELGRKQAELDGAGAALEQVRASLEQARNELEHLKADVLEAQGELSQTRGALEQTRETLDHTRAELGKTQADLKQSRSEHNQTRGDLDRARGALEQTRSELHRAHETVERAQNALEQMRTEFGHMRAELDQAQAALDRPLERERQTQEKLDLARNELEQARDDSRRSRQELTQAQDAFEQMTAQAQRRQRRWSQQRAQLMTELATISGSLWWRLSVPFRKAPASLAIVAADAVSEQAPDVDGPQIDGHQIVPVAGSVDELLMHHGETFVHRAYATLLGRSATPPELNQCLAQLMLGTSRESILTGISESGEGRHAGARLPGLEVLIRRRRRLHHPVIGPVLRAFAPGAARAYVPWQGSAGTVTGAGRGRIALSLDELLSLHDEPFVQCAYSTLLGREPDPDGLHRYLSRIRSGESRRAILAEIRLSPEGRLREELVPGLDRAIRPYRLRRLPVLGPLMRLSGRIDEPVDVQGQLAAIQSRLDLLARLTPVESAKGPSLAAPEIVPPSAPPAATEGLPSSPAIDPRPMTRGNGLATAAGGPAPGPAVGPAAIAWSAPLTWRIAASSDESSFVHIELARALAELGHGVVSASSLVDADMTAVIGLPPQGELPPGPALLVGLDWEESGFPAHWIGSLNDGLDGVACATRHTHKILVDHGLTVPAEPIGLGVDHWERISPNPDYRVPGKGLRFLHVSGCGADSGIDVLLQAFTRVFDDADDVSLIVCPLKGADDKWLAELEKLRSAHPDGPEIVVTEAGMPVADLKALYTQCQVFVAPGRAMGFGMPIAQALLTGLPVIVTGWGGHCDYCDETNGWMVDFRFRRAAAAVGLFASAWAEPKENSLEDTLLAAFQASAEERFAKGWSGRKLLLERYTWKDVALRLAAMAGRGMLSATAASVRPRIGWVTTWNVHCGIAGHVRNLLESVPLDDYVVFAARQEPRIAVDGPNVVRSWTPGKDQFTPTGLDEVEREMTKRGITALVIQHNYSFFHHRELAQFIETVIAKGVLVMLEFHSTTDPFGDVDDWRLSDFAAALRKCHRILVHGPRDMDRLRELGLVDNVMLMPLGVMNKPEKTPRTAPRQGPPLIASFGFCFPNKGLLELVETVGLMKRAGRPVRLRMVNAVAPHPFSAPVAEQIKSRIKELGLEQDVETQFEFLEDETCLRLLRDADLVVNPYQQTGESASAAIRHSMTTTRPVVVTPLPIFDDLGDAVFRMPGTTPEQMAEGISSALDQLEGDTEGARNVREAAKRWMEEHDYARQIDRLSRGVRALGPRGAAAPSSQTRPRRKKSGGGAGSQAKVSRGIFINTASASCSIFESGRMVYNSIKESDFYTLDYFSLDMIDVPALATEGRIAPLDPSKPGGMAADYDFWVFNWHFITMAPHLDNASIQRLPGRKFTVVLELEPGDPLRMVPRDVFDGFIALDPGAPEVDGMFPFPRPLEGAPRPVKSASRDIPVIGSFGFGTPGKGFELLVEAVNQAFDRAIVRINVPRGTYTSSTDVIHWQDYTQYLASICKRVAKPGVEVRFTHDYMTPEELLDWCAENDLNCFMYTRRQTGLSATTDQAIMSGRPLLTLSNDTFRHIHRYISPYPVVGLREAIETTAQGVRRLQRDWSRAAFGRTFERMLARFELIGPAGPGDDVSPKKVERRRTILVVSRPRPIPEDFVWYPTRVADALRRTTKYDILREYCDGVDGLREHAERHRPSAIVVLDMPLDQRGSIAAALNGIEATKIMLVSDAGQSGVGDSGVGDSAAGDSAARVDPLHVLQRKPIVPFYTSAAGLRTGTPAIWLVGFAAPGSNLEDVVARIANDLPEAVILLEVTADARPEFEVRVQRLRALPTMKKLQFDIHGYPADAEAIIANFVVTPLTVFYNDPARAEELETMSCLALTTERAVAFTRAAPFPDFGRNGTFVEDHAIADIIAMGMAAKIRLYHDFGEWQLYASIDRLLTEEEQA